MTERLTLAAARRIALAAQGFGAARPAVVNQGHLARAIDRLSLHQIDSVNVLVRAHYLPAFSRLGSYDRTLLDAAAWGRPSQRRLFEYWAHEASLLPLSLHPLLRWRMAAAERGEAGWSGMRPFATERRAEADAVLARIVEEGPMAASDFEDGRSRSGWWAWGDTKRALEWLFWAGLVTTRTRRGGFERVYDLTERVIPAAVLALPTPEPREAHRALVARAAATLGVATGSELRDYFRLAPDDARAAVESLCEERVLLPLAIEGLPGTSYLHRDARIPRRVMAHALLAPFDPLIWERSRTERLFGFRYRIGIYTPAEKRTHGYYVLPFLLDEALVARVDLKADRAHSKLLIQKLTLEEGAPVETKERLMIELERMAEWLGLEHVAEAVR